MIVLIIRPRPGTNQFYQGQSHRNSPQNHQGKGSGYECQGGYLGPRGGGGKSYCIILGYFN